jgi:hypothetical protein
MIKLLLSIRIAWSKAISRFISIEEGRAAGKNILSTALNRKTTDNGEVDEAE